jgi:EAL domain-containing protein (putative c-di-GMP-specific phosphodiesterase class I)
MIRLGMLPAHGRNADELLRHADLALYHAKDKGRGRYAFFKPKMKQAVQHKITLARDLRQAVSRSNELETRFQPQIDLAAGDVVGFEALMRWKHLERGYIPPSEFIPIAESSGLICDIGLWILRESAQQARNWLDAGEPERMVSVNVSTAQIWQTDLDADVEAILAQTGLPPRLLCLELTESLFADHSESRVRQALQSLKALGVTLALDDFGTGYSSLGYLTQLPFDRLKIDRIFVDGIIESSQKRKLLEGIIALGRGLGMVVVAEGAEKAEEVAILRQFGCDHVQGFVYSPPVPAEDALAFARAREASETLQFTARTDRISGSPPPGMAEAQNRFMRQLLVSFANPRIEDLRRDAMELGREAAALGYDELAARCRMLCAAFHTGKDHAGLLAALLNCRMTILTTKQETSAPRRSPARKRMR